MDPYGRLLTSGAGGLGPGRPDETNISQSESPFLSRPDGSQVLRGAGAGILATGIAGPTGELPPPGWPGFVSGGKKLQGGAPPGRGGLFDDPNLIGTLAQASATAGQSDFAAPSMGLAGFQGVSAPSSMMTGPARPDFMRGTSAPGVNINPVGLKRPETPVLAYVDRASIPGYIEPEAYNADAQHFLRNRELELASTWSGLEDARSNGPGFSTAGPASTATAEAACTATDATADDRWEAELLEWKRKYGCPEPASHVGYFQRSGTDARAEAEAAPTAPMAAIATAVTALEPEPAAAADAHASPAGEHPASAFPSAVGSAGAATASGPAAASPAAAAAPTRPVDPGAVEPASAPAAPAAAAGGGGAAAAAAAPAPPAPPVAAPPRAYAPRHAMEAQHGPGASGTDPSCPAWRSTDDAAAQPCRASRLDCGIREEPKGRALPAHPKQESVIPGRTGAPRGGNLPEEVVTKAEFQGASSGGAMASASPLRPLQQAPPEPCIQQHTAHMLQAFTGGEPAQPGMPRPQGSPPVAAPPAGPPLSPPSFDEVPASPAPSPPGCPSTKGRPAPKFGPLSARRPGSASRPASAGRRFVYTKEDLEVATADATRRLGPGGHGMSGYSEAGLQKSDFFADLRKQRDREKGRQATGPLWVHLASQAKNLSNSFDLNELLEAIKLFCSVRYDDYELYMRLLGEVPHYVKNATADQLCELIRLLARRRLRERNYVEMATAHLLQKIRITDDTLPARLLVKTANGLAALECRSQPKFAEHFLRHVEHRIEELDGGLCCMVSPLFVVNYMGDALRRAYLKRCAETQAGFHGPLYELRNLACTELVLRKEHHSFLASLPAYVGRFLEKIRQHAAFDKWGSVTLPPAAAPDGPKGCHRAEMCSSLQKKASTATGGQRGDVFNSDVHRDVSACLTHLGIEHENGVVCGPYLLDIVALDMETPSRRIVYEVNSAHHFYEGTAALTAEKRLRHRMLGRLGQKLHMVSVQDWRPLTAAQKMTFMLKMQQAQQEVNSKAAKQEAAANTMRSPLPVAKLESVKAPDRSALKLKSLHDLKAPIRVPVPPSQRTSLPLSAR